MSRTREELTATKEKGALDAHSCRGEPIYVWEEELHEETAAAASTCRCEREISKASGKHASRASTVPNAVAASEESRAVSPRHTTRCGRPSASPRKRAGLKSTWASSSASRVSSPSSSAPGFATGFNNQCAKRDDGCNDDGPRNDEAPDVGSSSHQQWAPLTGEENTHHRGGRRHRREKTNAAAGSHPCSVRTLSPPSPSTPTVNAVTPSRYRNRAEEGVGRVGPVVTTETVERDEEMAPIQQDEASGRPKPQHSGGGCGGIGDNDTATSVSPGQYMPGVEADSRRHHHRHQATAQAIDDRWIGSSPSSSITPTAGRKRFPQQAAIHINRQLAEHWEEEEPFRQAKIGHRLGEEQPFGSPAPELLQGEDENRPGGGEAVEEEGDGTAFVTAAAVAAAAEAVAISFALRSPDPPNALRHQEQEQEQEQFERQQYHDHHNHHQEEQHSPPLSSLSCATEMRTLPRSDWCSPSSGRRADLDSYVSAGAADAAAASEPAAGHACGSSNSSSCSQSLRSSRSYATESSHFSDPAGARQPRPETARVFSRSGSPSPPFLSFASAGPQQQRPPQGFPTYGERGQSGFSSEPVYSTRSDPTTPGRESRLTSRPGASRSTTPRSHAFSCRSGYSSRRSRQGSGNNSRPSSTGSTEATRSTGSSMFVSSSSGSASGSGSASPSRLGRRPEAGGRGDGSGMSIRCARMQPERPDGAHSEVAAPPPPPVQGHHDDGSATSEAGFAYPTNTVGSRLSSRSSLYGEKLDRLSLHTPSEPMGNRSGEEGHRHHAQGHQGKQGCFSSPSLSPLSSPLASPPLPPEARHRHHHPSSSRLQQRHSCHQGCQQDQRLTQQQQQQPLQQHSLYIGGSRRRPVSSQLSPPQNSDQNSIYGAST